MIRGDELGHGFVRCVCVECFTRLRVPLATLVERGYMETWRDPIPHAVVLPCAPCGRVTRRGKPIARRHFVDTSTEEEVFHDNAGRPEP